jgi:molecular chaperone DnaK
MPADLKKQVEQTISEARQALTADNVQTIRQAAERLQQQAAKMSEAISRAASQGATGGQSESSGSGSSSDNVVDAEFEEVDPGDRRAS